MNMRPLPVELYLDTAGINWNFDTQFEIKSIESLLQVQSRHVAAIFSASRRNS
jgi:hypothetical protein